MKSRLLLSAFGAGLAVASQASIVSVTGLDVRVFNPLNVVPNVVQSTFVNVFEERTNVLLSADLALDHVNTGLVNAPASMVPGIAASGTRVDSYFMHFDPTVTLTRTGRVTFSADILGIIIENPSFNASTPILGNPLTTYGVASGAFGLELAANSDRFAITADRRSIEFQWAANDPGDRMRVITAVPEPSTIAVLGLASAALLRRRRR